MCAGLQKQKSFSLGKNMFFMLNLKVLAKNNLCILSKQKFLKLVTNLKIDWSTWNWTKFQNKKQIPIGNRKAKKKSQFLEINQLKDLWHNKS